MSSLTRQRSTKVVKHVSWGKDWASNEGQRETRRPSRIEWKKNQKKKKNKRRFAKMNRTREDEQDYEKMQQRWMFDVLKEGRLQETILKCCAESLNPPAHLFLIFKHCGISTDIIPEGLEIFRKNIKWETFEDDEEKLEALLQLWRTKAVRSKFLLPGHFLSSPDTNESENGMSALRTIQDPQLLENIAGMETVVPDFFATWIIPYRTNNPALARKFEQIIFPPQAVDSVPSAAQLSGHRGTDPTESDSSHATILPKSSHEDDDHASPSGKSDPDSEAAKLATGAPKNNEEDANGPDDGDDSSAMSEGITRNTTRLKSTAAEE